jgi:type VI secretion system protein ImpC
MAERLEFELGFGRGAGRRRDESDPMRLLLIGDFSGAAAVERGPLADRAIRRVDIDNLDQVMRQLQPHVQTAAGEIRFGEIGDFHPDRLYAGLDLFRGLRESRAAPPATGGDSDVARLLGKPADARQSPLPKSGIDALIHDAVAPYVVKDASPRAAHLAAVDAASAHEMRTLLHAPEFQALEAAWRGVKWLVSGLELDENLQLHIMDVSRDELLADLHASAGKLADTGFYRAVVERSRVPGAGRWSALVALFTVGRSEADLALIEALGLIASHAGGPLLAGGELGLADESTAESSDWRALRRRAAARSIALAAPRVLLRLPYGRKSDPIESFAFDELVGPPAESELLWGCGALAMAVLLGRSFTARGWAMEPGDERDIDDLPAYTFTRDGEREMQPCVERLLNEREIDALLKAGLVPIAGRRDRNAIVVVRFQCASDPPAPLMLS